MSDLDITVKHSELIGYMTEIDRLERDNAALRAENYGDLLDQMDDAWGTVAEGPETIGRVELQAFLESRGVHRPTTTLRHERAALREMLTGYQQAVMRNFPVERTHVASPLDVDTLAAALRERVEALTNGPPAQMSYDGRLVPINAAGMREVVDEAARLKRQLSEAQAPRFENGIQVCSMGMPAANHLVPPTSQRSGWRRSDLIAAFREIAVDGVLWTVNDEHAGRLADLALSRSLVSDPYLSEKYRVEIATTLGMKADSHFGDISTVLAARLRSLGGEVDYEAAQRVWIDQGNWDAKDKRWGQVPCAFVRAIVNAAIRRVGRSEPT